MTHKAIFDIFNTKFLSQNKKPIKEWFPNGRGSIRVVFDDRSVIIFSWENDEEWSIETMKKFLKNL